MGNKVVRLVVPTTALSSQAIEPRTASRPYGLQSSDAFDNPILRAIDQLQASQDARIDAIFGGMK